MEWKVIRLQGPLYRLVKLIAKEERRTIASKVEELIKEGLKSEGIKISEE